MVRLFCLEFQTHFGKMKKKAYLFTLVQNQIHEVEPLLTFRYFQSFESIESFSLLIGLKFEWFLGSALHFSFSY